MKRKWNGNVERMLEQQYFELKFIGDHCEEVVSATSQSLLYE
jgi:hypothetical protein